ncbi:MAG: hypothetical protein WBM11_12740, partial [Terriglobales bacterium]
AIQSGLRGKCNRRLIYIRRNKVLCGERLWDRQLVGRRSDGGLVQKRGRIVHCHYYNGRVSASAERMGLQRMGYDDH